MKLVSTPRAVATAFVMACGGAAVAQTGAAPAPSPASLVAPTRIKVPEGTEIHCTLGERLSSSTNAAGDTFTVVLDEEVKLPDGTVLKPGYTGRGEVSQAEHNGMLGKSGQLNIRLEYLKVGTERIHLRANKSGEGKSGVTNTVVATVLLGPLGLLVHGHSVVYPKGTPVLAYADQDTELTLPLPPPPVSD